MVGTTGFTKSIPVITNNILLFAFQVSQKKDCSILLHAKLVTLRAGYQQKQDMAAFKNDFLPFFMNLYGTRNRKPGAKEHTHATIQIRKPSQI
jgi:hypothetical protein